MSKFALVAFVVLAVAFGVSAQIHRDFLVHASNSKCNICQMAVDSVKGGQGDVKARLLHECKKLPIGSEVCKTKLLASADKIASHLALPSSEICQKIRWCVKTTADQDTRSALVQNKAELLLDLKCASCQGLFTFIYTKIGRNLTNSDLANRLRDICSKAPFVVQGLCNQVISQNLDKIVAAYDNGDPNKICQNIKLCSAGSAKRSVVEDDVDADSNVELDAEVLDAEVFDEEEVNEVDAEAYDTDMVFNDNDEMNAEVDEENIDVDEEAVDSEVFDAEVDEDSYATDADAEVDEEAVDTEVDEEAIDAEVDEEAVNAEVDEDAVDAEVDESEADIETENVDEEDTDVDFESDDVDAEMSAVSKRAILDDDYDFESDFDFDLDEDIDEFDIEDFDAAHENDEEMDAADIDAAFDGYFDDDEDIDFDSELDSDFDEEDLDEEDVEEEDVDEEENFDIDFDEEDMNEDADEEDYDDAIGSVDVDDDEDFNNAEILDMDEEDLDDEEDVDEEDVDEEDTDDEEIMEDVDEEQYMSLKRIVDPKAEDPRVFYFGLEGKKTHVEVQKLIARIADQGTGSAECQICQWAVSAVEAYISQQDTEQELARVLQELCTVLPGNYASICQNFVVVYMDEAVNYVIDNLTPPLVCSKLDVCPQGPSQAPVPTSAAQN